jgi:hypothetical protein
MILRVSLTGHIVGGNANSPQTTLSPLFYGSSKCPSEIFQGGMPDIPKDRELQHPPRHVRTDDPSLRVNGVHGQGTRWWILVQQSVQE